MVWRLADEIRRTESVAVVGPGHRPAPAPAPASSTQSPHHPVASTWRGRVGEERRRPALRSSSSPDPISRLHQLAQRNNLIPNYSFESAGMGDFICTVRMDSEEQFISAPHSTMKAAKLDVVQRALVGTIY